jgi:hypothetical protein
VPDLRPDEQVEPARGGEGQAQRVLGDGHVVQAGPAGDDDLRREAGREHRVRAGREALHPPQPGQPLGRVAQLPGRVAPHHQRLGVRVHVGNRLVDGVHDALDAGGQVQVDAVGQ